MLALLFITLAQAADVSFITVKGKPVVEVVTNNTTYQVTLSKKDIETKTPEEIVRMVCQSLPCHSK